MDINWKQIQPARSVGDIKAKVKATAHGQFHVLKLQFSVPLCHTSEEEDPEFIVLQAKLVYSPDRPIVLTTDESGKLDMVAGSMCASNANSMVAGSMCESNANSTVAGSMCAGNAKSMVVYLCGGPGDANLAFANPELNKIILEEWGHPILFLDYRGTGRSTRITTETLEKRKSPSEYLTRFRQDAIVADLEAIRLCFFGVKFLLIGQSFGGWIAMTYVSFLPESLSSVFITAGLPPIGKEPEDVYEALYERVIRANEQYYAMYPDDKAKVKKIVHYLEDPSFGKSQHGEKGKSRENRGVMLPDGQRLTPEGFMTMGRHFGGEDGFRKVHSIVDLMARDIDLKSKRGLKAETIERFWKSGGAGFKLHQRPCYGTLHEPIYCSGKLKARPDWAAQRVGRQQGGGHFRWLEKGFDGSVLGMDAYKDIPLYFTGEMIHDFMLEDAGPAAAPFKAHADDLARRVQWSTLYDVGRLSQNVVPVRAVVYPEDLYVDYGFSIETAAMVGTCLAVTAPSGWLHGSIKTSPKDVCEKLFSTAVPVEG